MKDSEDFDKVSPSDMKALLERSGYLFEQEVGSRIEKMGFEVETNKAFLDSDEGKSRELDVRATQSFMYRKEKSIIGFCNLNCECKNSSTPYVFITRRKNRSDLKYIPDGMTFPTDMIGIFNGDDLRSWSSYPTFEYLQLSKDHYACNTDIKAVQICKLVRKGKEFEMQHSGVIESFVYPLVKSMHAFAKLQIKSNSIQQKVYLTFNLAIVNSKLYTVDSHDMGSLPVEVPFVPFVRDIHTETIQGKQLITFVNERYIEKFLQNEIFTFTNAVKDVMLKNPDLFTFSTNGTSKVYTKEEAILNT